MEELRRHEFISPKNAAFSPGNLKRLSLEEVALMIVGHTVTDKLVCQSQTLGGTSRAFRRMV